MQYNRNTVIERITELKGKRGSKDYISNAKIAEYLHVKDRTVKNWLKERPENIQEESKGYPDIPFPYIVKLCDLFKCDIEYLLDETMSCKTKEATDIQKATGLSEEAITTLQSETNSEKSIGIVVDYSDLKMKLINFLILDLNYRSGFMAHILQSVYDKRIIDDYSKNPWFDKIKGMIDSIYQNNQNLRHFGNDRYGNFMIESEIKTGICNALHEEGLSYEEIENIDIETDFFFQMYQEYLTNAEIIKARIQIILTEYLNHYLFGGIEYGK